MQGHCWSVIKSPLAHWCRAVAAGGMLVAEEADFGTAPTSADHDHDLDRAATCLHCTADLFCSVSALGPTELYPAICHSARIQTLLRRSAQAAPAPTED